MKKSDKALEHTIDIKKLIKRADEIHKVQHASQRVFGEWLEDLRDDDRLDKFAKEHDVVVSPCDDAYFCSSRILLIPSYGMGATLAIAPQCTSVNNQAFLYTDDIDRLIDALKTIKKKVNHE